MVQLMSITDRVILWNSQRYDQVYDYGLASRLLLEETQELFDAHSVVDKLDAIGDIVFVAIGVLWKLGLPNEVIHAIFHDHDLAEASLEECNHIGQNVIFHGMDMIDDSIEGVYPGLGLTAHSVFVTALAALRGLKMQRYFYDVVHCICDSNATKEIKGKVDATVKANVDKGKGFIPPTDALHKLYLKACKEMN